MGCIVFGGTEDKVAFSSECIKIGDPKKISLFFPKGSNYGADRAQEIINIPLFFRIGELLDSFVKINQALLTVHGIRNQPNGVDDDAIAFQVLIPDSILF